MWSTQPHLSVFFCHLRFYICKFIAPSFALKNQLIVITNIIVEGRTEGQRETERDVVYIRCPLLHTSSMDGDDEEAPGRLRRLFSLTLGKRGQALDRLRRPSSLSLL